MLDPQRAVLVEGGDALGRRNELRAALRRRLLHEVLPHAVGGRGAVPDGDLAATLQGYDPARLSDGYNTVDGEKIFFISNPALGLWARLRGARRLAAVFASKTQVFAEPDAAARERLRRLIEEKKVLLKDLEPGASEGTFSVTLHHVLRRPGLSRAYLRLAREESRLLGTRAAVGAAQAWWRPLHIALAWLFALGVLIHVLTVTFFAGYVAGGRPITWWHFASWGAGW